MRCEEIRSLLMTDYIDGELDAKTEALVKEHLASCAACRAFEEEVSAVTVTPFKAAKVVAPPERVWTGIKNRIDKESEPYTIFDRLRDLLEALFVLPRMRVAVAAIATVVIVFALMGYQRYAQERSLDMYIEEGASYLYQLSANGSEDTNDLFGVGNFYEGNSV